VALVREDGNRYVLIHEMMHFFFYAERVRENQPRLLDVQNETRALMNILESESALTGEAALNDQAELTLKLTRNVDQMMLLTYLEEVAVESILTEEISAGRLKYTPDARENAKRYIQFAIFQSSQVYTELSLQLSNLRNQAERLKALRAIELTKTAQALIRNRVKELEKFVETDSTVALTDFSPAPPCGQIHQMSTLISALKRINGR
jgi:hypothetical protein